MVPLLLIIRFVELVPSIASFFVDAADPALIVPALLILIVTSEAEFVCSSTES